MTEARTPGAYVPEHLAERIGVARRDLEGERKQVTVLFADLKQSMELLADRDPEDARRILDPVLERMMEAVHHYEGTVNQVMGDGIMALFGAPLAHEDHAVRACYAALRMQASVKGRAAEVARAIGVPVQIRVGLNSGHVVVRSIANDLSMDYSAIGQTTHLAARMEQMAPAGAIFMTANTWRLTEGLVTARLLGRQPVKGLTEPVDVYELLGAVRVRPRFRATVPGLTSFVGREDEIGRLSRARADAGTGRGQVVAVVGDPGIGKSRLVYELLESCRRDGWRIAEGRTVAHGRATPYLSVVGLLESYFGLDEGEDPHALREKIADQLHLEDSGPSGALSPLLALLGLPTGDAEWESLDPREQRRATIDAVTRVLLRASTVQRLVVVVEDLQWIDAQSEAVLDSLIDSLSTARLLLLLTYRPEYDDRWTKKSHHTLLRIEHLSAVSAEQLLETLVGEDASTQPLQRSLVARTEGNPFFLEESVRMLADTGMLQGDPGAYRLAQEITALNVPPTVQAVLASRIDRLAPLAKRVLQSAAVVGKDVSFAILQRIADIDEDTLRTVLTTLQEAGFLHETRLFPDLEYTFRHALTHEVAYEGILLKRRRDVHAVIVEAIEALYGVRAPTHAVVLAHHAQQGELWEKAVRYLRVAAAQAAARSAHQEVITQLRHAIDALDHLPESRDRTEAAVDLRFALRNSLFALGHHDQTLTYLHEAEALAGALGDQYRLGWVSCYLMVQCLLVGDYVKILEHGERALSAGKALGEVSLQTVANMGLGQAHHAMGHYREALVALEESVKPLRGPLRTQRFGMTSPPSVAGYTWQAWCHAERGDFAQALASGREALQIADEINDPWGRAGARFGIGLAHLLQGNFVEAIDALDAGLEIARAFALRTWFPPLASALGHSRCQAGDIAAGVSLLESAVAQASAMGLTVRHSLRVCWLGEAYLAEGRIADASEMADRALQLATDHRERGYAAWALRLLGDVAARAGRIVDAEDHYVRAVALAEELEMRPCLARCYLEVGTLQARTGRVDEARESVDKSARLFDAMQMAWWSKRAASARDLLG
jgi:class 3 adenylate cyclase/tetratricopeptide (TPR) repeat protein